MTTELMPTAGAAFANRLLALPGVFVDREKERRIVQGIATTNKKNLNGHVLGPLQAKWELPLPLIYQHDWRTPLGRVSKINATAYGLFFEARIIDGRLRWADECWGHLKFGRILSVSLFPQPLAPYVGGWQVLEISLCDTGGSANDEACVHIVKTVDGPGSSIHLDGTRETVYRHAPNVVEPCGLRRLRNDCVGLRGASF